MKKLTISAVLAFSSGLAMVGCTQASAVSETQASPATQLQKQHKGQGHEGKPRRGYQAHGGMAHKGGLEKLDLTAQQQAQLKALKEQKQQKRQAQREQAQAQRQQMRAQTQALINSTTLNQAELNRLADQHAAEAKAKFIERIQEQRAMAQILTDEQKSQMQQRQLERQNHKQR